MNSLAVTWSWQLDGWTVVAGSLAALSCALLGNFLVLRRMSMMGDAISHAVLPGIAIAFLWSGSRGSLPMFLGAAVAGVLTALLTQWVHSLGKVEQSASMGVVFTLLFAIGLILIERGARAVDLDPECVLYGAIETIGTTGGPLGIPPAVIRLGAVFLIDLLFVVVCYKELKISSFDPGLATTLGFNATLMHYLLMTAVAVTTVAAFESVGSVLVIAMLIAPGAAAHMLTERLPPMIIVSAVIAVLSAVLGHYTAVVAPGWFGYEGVSTLTSGMMAVVVGVILGGVVLFAPRQGIVSKLAHRMALSLRIIREDVLGLLYRLEELEQRPKPETAAILRRAIGMNRAVSFVAMRQLIGGGAIVADNGGYRLTETGRASARDVVRSHRLWESYLAKHLGLPLDHLHEAAASLEHITDTALRKRLDEGMERPKTDPHGRSMLANQHPGEQER